MHRGGTRKCHKGTTRKGRRHGIPRLDAAHPSLLAMMMTKGVPMTVPNAYLRIA